jgi:thiol-disulfide isomerase/thioredoxin
MKIIILLLLTLLHFFSVQGQENIIIKLNHKRINENVIGLTTPILFYNDFKNYSGINYDTDSIWIGRIILNREQYWYDQSKLKDSLETYYLEKLKEMRVNLDSLSKIPIKTFTSVLVKIKNEKKTIVLDTDNDFSFSNENEISFSTKNKTKFYESYDNVNAYPVSFEIFLNSKVEKRSEIIKIKPLDTSYNYKNKIDSIKAVYFRPDTYLEGNFIIEDKKYKVNVVRSNKFGFNPNPIYYSYSFVQNYQEIRDFDWIKINQKLKINNSIIQIIDFSADSKTISIYMRPANNTDFGWNVGEYVPDQIMDKYVPNFKDSKYNLVNFWGSWCSPCIKEIPELIQLNNHNGSSINLINLSCEYNTSGIENAKELVKKNNLNWNQKYSLLEEKESLSNILNVKILGYPIIIRTLFYN